MSASNNPSAFPVNTANLPNPGAYEADPGMTLRDWFAGQAIGAVVRQCAGDGVFGLPEGINSMEQLFAVNAYFIADALLAERAKAGAA